MFNLFSKQPVKLVRHQFKNLSIDLPFNWHYEMEEADQEACFDPTSNSTLRINIIMAIPPDGLTTSDRLKILTNNQSFVTTTKEYFLTEPLYSESIESGQNITLISWKLINNTNHDTIIAILAYTVLTAKLNSKKEKDFLSLIENSLRSADLSR